MSRKIIITGATGLIGKQLCHALLSRGDEVTVFTRNVDLGRNILGENVKCIKWDYNKPAEWQEFLKDKDAIIHLAGANLFAKRWTENYKKIILESRVQSTKSLVSSLQKTQSKVKVLVTSSGVGYYGSRGDEILTEKSSSGKDFLSHVVHEWESETAKASHLGIRTIMLRQGIVLSSMGGALKKFLIPFKLFVGGTLGSGNQWLPWLHIQDLVSAYLFILDNPQISGAINAASPNQVKMNEFAKTLGTVLKRLSIFKVPGFALKILVGEAAATILSSQRVVPQKLLDYGFKFKFEKLEDALIDLLRQK